VYPIHWYVSHLFSLHSVIVCTDSTLQEVLHCQWCVELWSCGVQDMEHWTQTIWGIYIPTIKYAFSQIACVYV